MTILYKGAGPGTHWWTNDPRTLGGFLAAAGVANSAQVVKHITAYSYPSPYLSFSASFAVACSYAMTGPAGAASPATPGYVYEIDLSLLPNSLRLVDPVLEISKSLAPVGAATHYSLHHDGGQDLILGIASPVRFRRVLRQAPRRLAAAAGSRPPTFHPELQAAVFALRDSEVLISGQVPAVCIVARHNVY